jgi:integrase/recombinase XerD
MTTIKHSAQENLMTTSLRPALDKFLLANRAEAKSPKTQRSYKDILEDFEKFIGDIPVETITADHFRGYIADVSSRQGIHGKMSISSVHKYYSVVRTLLLWMFDQRMMSNRITDYTKAPRLSDDLPEALTDEELSKLFTFLAKRRTFRDLVIFELFLDTGIRLNELVELNLDDVHLDQHLIRVIGKGRKEDFVPIGKKCADDLRKYVNSNRNHTALPGERALFVKDAGDKLGREGVSILVRRVLHQIGKNGKAGPHILRHTFSTLFLRNGGGMEELRLILRHKDIRMTQRYVHLLQDDIIAGHRKASPLDNLSKIH